MNQIPLDWFVCPVTKEPLTREGDFLVNGARKFALSPEGNFWNFTPQLEELKKPIWKTWEQLQENGIVSYIEDPTKNLGVGQRRDHLQFKDFVGFEGRILDIGVGPQSAPSHVEYSSAAELEGFVGIDPLRGDLPKKYKFVQGLGEYLPFRKDFFDKTMFVTSLDHFVSPVNALASARDVTKADGTVCVWIGEKSKNAPRPASSPAWYQELKVPEGAEDQFHIKRFNLDDFKKMVDSASLNIKEHVALKVDEWRANHFFKLQK